MKKTLLIFGMFAATINLSAQQAGLPANATLQKPAHNPMVDFNAFKSTKGKVSAKNALVDEFWLNYGSSIDQLNGGGPGLTGPAILNANYLFPDSLCYGEFGTGNFAPIWIHHLGDVLDVKSYIFNAIDNVTWDATTSYSLDSMSVLYSYTRVDSVVDTLIVTLLTNAAAVNMPGYYFTGTTAANYLTDTLSFRGLKYTQATNSINAGATLKFKVLLTDADTAITLFREKQFAVPSSFIVPPDKLLGVDIQFKPGYSYALGDSIDYQHNAFYFTSYEEFGDNGGAGTFPTYQDCDLLSPLCDYNCSFIVPQTVRYNMAGTWNGLFIPSWAYTAPYGFEHHLISYKVTSPPLGTAISEISRETFALAQNQPNPFTNQTTITYQLNKQAAVVSLEVTDVRGLKMIEKTQTNMHPGKYSYDILTSSFAQGIYFCSLIVDGERITNKIVKQ